MKELTHCKPCPFCGGTYFKWTYRTNHGHGDCTFQNLRVVCKNDECFATNGISNWGMPRMEDYDKAVKAWNKRIEP